MATQFEDALAALQRKVEDLTARVSALDKATPAAVDTQYEAVFAWWRVDFVYKPTNFTPGADWNGYFDGRITDPIIRRMRIATLSGDVRADWFTNSSTTVGRRLRIAWDSAQEFDYTLWITADFGRVQFRSTTVARTEYTSNQRLTLRSVRGHNFIEVLCNPNTDELMISTTVLDQPGVTWRDPYGEEGLYGPLKTVGGTGGGNDPGGAVGLGSTPLEGGPL